MSSTTETCIALSTIPPNGETCIALSTVARRGALPRPEKNSFGVARRNKAQLALAVLDPRIAALDRARQARGLSHPKLCAAAGIHQATWRALRAGQQAPKQRTIESLEAAIATTPQKPRTQPLAALVRAAEALLAGELARDPTLVAAATYRRANRKETPAMAEGRLRTLALYLVAVEVEVGNAEIGRALGMTRANVHKARNTIEDLADEPRVRALLDRVAATLRGEGNAGAER